jgi:hypothetical protein
MQLPVEETRKGRYCDEETSTRQVPVVCDYKTAECLKDGLKWFRNICNWGALVLPTSFSTIKTQVTSSSNSKDSISSLTGIKVP